MKIWLCRQLKELMNDVVTYLRQLMNRQLRMLEFVHDTLLEYLDKYLHHILLQNYKCNLWK